MKDIENISNHSEIKEIKNEHVLILPYELVNTLINKLLDELHIKNEVKSYVIPNNDELINTMILRLAVEIFTDKINMEANEPYIVNTVVGETKYRLSITKIKDENDYKYMYGLVMN
jgi:hypothetical protein